MPRKLSGGRLVAGVLAGGLLAAGVGVGRAADPDPREDASPWGMASGAEWSGAYAKFDPLLEDAGVTWMRYFPEWGSIERKQGQMNWAFADSFVADSAKHHIKISAIFGFLAPHAAADGGTRAFPLKNIQFWRDYVGATVTRYQKDIKYWEVWNEWNGGFQKNGKIENLAELVKETNLVTKKIDPTAKVGISCANFNVALFDMLIKAGAADNFDFVCIHPYENTGSLMYGGEIGYLSMAAGLRDMLAANKQNPNMPLWITEGGLQSTVAPDAKADASQAEALVKYYVLSLAQGFDRVCWFEPRGPSYGKGPDGRATDYGVIRPDWTLRPSHTALKTMTGLLGKEPKYAGWLVMDKDGYGFVFDSFPGAKFQGVSVLAAWAPVDTTRTMKFEAPVRVVDLTGKETKLAAGEALTLSRTPVFITDLPPALVAQAKAQAKQPFPWGGDYAKATSVKCSLGETNVDDGMRQVMFRSDTENRTVGATVDGQPCRKAISKDRDKNCIYFRTDPRFARYGDTNLTITVVARRALADTPVELGVQYETLKSFGYPRSPEHWTIPADAGWHEFSWKLTDANFAGTWSWNFGITVSDPATELLIKEVRVSKAGK